MITVLLTKDDLPENIQRLPWDASRRFHVTWSDASHEAYLVWKISSRDAAALVGTCLRQSTDQSRHVVIVLSYFDISTVLQDICRGEYASVVAVSRDSLDGTRAILETSNVSVLIDLIDRIWDDCYFVAAVGGEVAEIARQFDVSRFAADEFRLEVAGSQSVGAGMYMDPDVAFVVVPRSHGGSTLQELIVRFADQR